MRKVELAPIPETPGDFERIEAEIVRLFRDEIYLPLLKLVGIPKGALKNDLEDLARAIASGRVRFYRGRFTGKWNATLTKEFQKLGAEYDRSTKSWKLPLSEVPEDLRAAIAVSESRAEKVFSRIEEKLYSISPDEIALKFRAEKLFDRVLFKTSKRLEDQINAISICPKLSPEARAKIAEEYTQNLRLYIKKWTGEEIVKLRERVEKSAVAGNRYGSLVSTIQKSYGVSQNKAKFLARQETSLLMAKFKETRYRDAGSEEYIWRCVNGSPKHPVRPYHEKLNGTRQRWDSPPIIDKNGNRKHPGEDYACRCTARALLKR